MSIECLLSLRLLGSFEARHTRPDRPVELRRQTRLALAYLAATNQPQSRQTLMDLFCQDAADPPRALRSILSRLRQRLGPEALLSEGNTVRFNPAVSWVDCVEFAHRLEDDLDAFPLEILASTVDLYRGEFLQNVSLSDSPEFEFWLLNERARYRQLYERGLRALITRLTNQGEIETAILRAQQLLRSDPLIEEAHARLMWLYVRNGQRETALEQYEQCRQYLQRELAVEPTPELQALRDEIATGQLSPPRPLFEAVVEWVSPTPERGDFVGRTAELTKLHQAWKEARAGQPSVVLVDAEAGMGKTRLVREFARMIPEANFLMGECYESARARPYSPWLEVLEARLADLDETSLGQLSVFAVDYLTRLMPALARRLKKGRPRVVPTSGGELSRLFAAISEFLLELQDTPPVLLFIDNLQWADEASLQLFHFLARRSSPGKVILIGAVRTEEVEGAPELQSLISDVQQHPHRHLHLSPLTPQGVTELSAQLWPSLPEGYRPHVCDLLVKATGGNPLFVSEVLRELAHTTEVPSALPVPNTVRELIRRRLNLLPESSRQVVEAMAILDSPATPSQAQQISGRSEDETITAIDLALRRGLLQAQAEADLIRYDFGHDLMREAVAGQLSPIRRQLLHRRASLTLERDGAPAATLAYHWRMAGDVEREGHFAALAGEQAAAVYANDEAVRYLERGLTLIHDPKRRVSVLCRLGEVVQLLGRHPESETIYRQALALAESVADHLAQARCQVALGKLMRLRGDYAQALAWLDMARAAYQALGDQKGLAQAFGGLGAVYWSQLDYANALACFQEQLDIATRLGDRQGIGAAMGSMGVVYAELGDYTQALKCYAQRIQTDLELNDRLSLAKTIGNMGIVYAELGEYRHALVCYHCLLRETLDLGDRQNVCVALGNMISVYTALGQYRVAERVSRQAITLGRALNIPLYLCEYLHTGAELFAHQGRYLEARTLSDEAVSMAAQIGRTDIQVPARLLSIRLRTATEEANAAKAVEELESLLGEWPEDQHQAAILYELWRYGRLSPHRDRAVELYGRLFAKTPNVAFRQRYEELSGKPLPLSPPAPPPPDVVIRTTIDFEALLSRVDQLIAGLDEAQGT